MNFYLVGCVVVATLSLTVAFIIVQRNPSRLNVGMAVGFVAHALWAIGSAGAVVAATPEEFWTWFRWGLTGYIVLGPIILYVGSVQGRIRNRVLLLALGILGLLSGIEVVVAWTSGWIFSGYHASAWGNVADLAPSNFWFSFNLIKGTLSAAVAAGFLIWGWVHHPSRRYRATVISLFVLGLIIDVAFTFCVVVVWQAWGYPDPSVLVGGPVLVGTSYVMSRYNALSRDSAGFGAPHFYHLTEMVVVVDAQGRIRQVSRPFCQALDTVPLDLERRELADVLDGWGNLRQALLSLQPPQSHEVILEGHLRGVACHLVLTPHVDEFGDLGSVLIKVKVAHSLDEAVLRFEISARERDVAIELLAGSSTEDIASKLFISPATVKNHLHSLFRKTQTANRVELSQLLGNRSLPV